MSGVARLKRIPGHSLTFLVAGFLIFRLADWLGGTFQVIFQLLGWGCTLAFLFFLPGDLHNLPKEIPGARVWVVLTDWCERQRRWFLRWEVLLAALIILPAGLFFGKSLGAMANTSLRVDEIGSIRSYTSRSPLEAATKYNLAKNHLFFSVLNSLTPVSNSLHPLRARMWSFVAVTAALVVLLIYFWRQGSPLAGAIAFALPALNIEHLSKALQARGFGVLALTAALGLIAAHAYLKTRRRSALWLLGTATVIGIWTLPYYVLFGGGLMLLVFLLEPRRETFQAGLAAALASLALYSPVLLQVAGVASGYSEDYEPFFVSIPAFLSSLNYAFPFDWFPLYGPFAVGGLLFVLVVAFLIPEPARVHSRILGVTLILILLFGWFCLVMRTPPARVSTFLAMPFAFVAALAVLAVLDWRGILPLRPLIAGLIAFPLALHAWDAGSRFSYTPDQRWGDAAEVIRREFPDGATIFVPEYGNMLRAYLRSGYRFEDRLPERGDWEGADVVLFDSAHNGSHVPIPVRKLYPDMDLEMVEFPVRGGIKQVLYFRRPE